MKFLGHMCGRICAVSGAFLLVSGTLNAAPDGDGSTHSSFEQGVWLSSFDQLEHMIAACDAALAQTPENAGTWHRCGDSFRYRQAAGAKISTFPRLIEQFEGSPIIRS